MLLLTRRAGGRAVALKPGACRLAELAPLRSTHVGSPDRRPAFDLDGLLLAFTAVTCLVVDMLVYEVCVLRISHVRR